MSSKRIHCEWFILIIRSLTMRMKYEINCTKVRIFRLLDGEAWKVVWYSCPLCIIFSRYSLSPIMSKRPDSMSSKSSFFSCERPQLENWWTNLFSILFEGSIQRMSFIVCRVGASRKSAPYKALFLIRASVSVPFSGLRQ